MSELPEVLLFLQTLNNITYVNAVTVLRKKYNTIEEKYEAKTGFTNVTRIIITTGDGNVWFDSSKNDEFINPVHPNSNNFQNYVNGTINENHNTRYAFSQAIINCNGKSHEYKLTIIGDNNTVKNEYRFVQRQLISDNGFNAGSIGLSFQFPL